MDGESHPSIYLMSIGFKEWALICEALGSGRQSIILRKGGIAEGRAGFRFQHPSFLLFPTRFHEQVAKMRIPAETPLPAARLDGQIEIHYSAHVEWTRDIADWSVVERLAPFHLWQPSEIEKRFQYEEKAGVSLAFIRVSRLPQPFVFPDSKKFGGCRSWVELPDPPDAAAAREVLDDSVVHAREAEIQAMLQ